MPAAPHRNHILVTPAAPDRLRREPASIFRKSLSTIKLTVIANPAAGELLR